MAKRSAHPGPDEGIAPFATRLWAHIRDPRSLAGPPAAAALCACRAGGLLSPRPYWQIVALVLAAQAVTMLTDMAWGEGNKQWHVTAFVGAMMGVIAVVAYSTGWGPILSLGFIFGAATSVEHFGSKAVTGAMLWTILYMGLGELAIATKLAPSLIREPLVHGLAGLCAVGVLLTIAVLGSFVRAQEELEGELRHSEGRFRALVQNASDIIVVVGADGLATYVSPAFERILGTDPTTMSGDEVTALMHPDDRAHMLAEAGVLSAEEPEPLRVEIRLRQGDGTWRWFDATVTNRLRDPNVRGIVANLHDISSRKEAEEELRHAHERFHSAFVNAPIGMAMSDLEGNIVRANPALGRIVGLDADELTGVNVHELTHPDDRETSRSEMHRLASNVSEGYHIEKRYRHADGSVVWVSVSVSCVRDEHGEPSYLIGQVEDVTERRALRERLAYAAIHDPLTSLPNRVLFMDRLETALSRASRHDRRVAVVFLDLDRFKFVNDGMGHAAGDRLLESVAERLLGSVRPHDTVARFGGDEFVVLCDEVDGEEAAVEIAERLTDALNRPIALLEGEIFVTASLGVALSVNGADNAARLLRDADTAMYMAKERGRARIEVFDPQSHGVVLHRMRIRSDLHNALERDELRVYYQPIVNLDSGRMESVEALLRWEHPERGLLPPGEFLPIAEESGLIVPIGAWVLEEACRQVVTWGRLRHHDGLGAGTIGVSVNVSPRQLSEPGFVDQVASIVAATGVEPASVWLEITEGALADDTEATLRVLHQLQALGVRLAIDDFGTGYASLGYLKSFPVHALKVDRSFVADLGTGGEGDATIVRAVIALARSLGLACVAEGIERPEQLEHLRALGCDFVQGFLLGVPLPADVLGERMGDDLSVWTIDGAALFDALPAAS